MQNHSFFDHKSEQRHTNQLSVLICVLGWQQLSQTTETKSGWIRAAGVNINTVVDSFRQLFRAEVKLTVKKKELCA